MSITAERLRELLDYDPETGIFRWKIARGCQPKGAVAGYTEADGYIQIRIDGNLYRAHRLAWLWTYGVLPDLIDHQFADPSDTRLAGLRLANKSLNGANRGMDIDNTSGQKGVTYHRKGKRWMAQITAAGKHYYLGLHDTPELANAAYMAKAVELFGDFARSR